VTVTHTFQRRTLAVFLLSAVMAVAAANAVPPINDPPSDERRPGKFVWVDLVTSDVATARRFYGGLFGWTFARPADVPEDYLFAYRQGAPVAGIASRPPVPGQARQGRWVAYISVGNVSRVVDMATYRGATVLIPARTVEGRGDMALLADPDGAPFGLVRSASGDPPDYLAGPGEWIWAVYQGQDANGATAFYQDLGGYEVTPDQRFGDRHAYTLVADGYARAIVVEIPAERAELRPEWLYFARVADVPASLARTRELGGRVLVDPDPALLGGRLAVVADPTGAPLGLMEWTDGEGN
jgi:predicted enzyme related to lactoylglutathione lyase